MQQVLKILFVLIALLFVGKSFSQNLSPKSEISILTVSPGKELFNAFGHSGLRVNDTINNIDVVFNYGIFDFRQPNFYTNFIKGKLLYSLGKSSTSRFLRHYDRQGRQVIEQTAKLNEADQQKIIEFLEHNYLPENRDYLYDFFFDNCASRIRDVFENELGEENFAYSAIPIASEKSFREMLDIYTKNNGRLWADFGMDLILGLPSDAICDERNQMFLPDFLMENMAGIAYKKNNLLSAKEVLVPLKSEKQIGLPITPIMATLIFLALALIVSFLITSQVVKNLFDGSMLLILGVSGLLFLCMWLFTDHMVCHKNLNMLWANPLYLAFPFLFKNRWFWLTVLFISLVVLASFPFSPQQFHLAFIPIFLGIIVRSFLRIKN